MHLLHCLFFVEAAFNFSFIPKHLPGQINEVADALSHNILLLPLPPSPPPLLQANVLEHQPIEIPTEIPNLLLNMQVDWPSETWTALFNSILSKV